MDLSPNDIRSYEFSNQMRGYDKDEVDGFLEQAAAALEAAKQEHLKLSMEVDSLKSQLSGLRQFEETIKSAAIDARRNADKTISEAKAEAEQLLSSARSEADNLVANKTVQCKLLDEQIEQLSAARKSYLSKLRSLISSHLELVEQISEAEVKAEISSDWESQTATKPRVLTASERVQVTESADVTREAIETVATPTEEDNADDSDSETQTVDPELVKALRNYQHDNEFGPSEFNEPITEKKGTPIASPHKAPSLASPHQKWSETTARAEDVPEGFFVKPELSAPSVEADTDKVAINGQKASRSVTNPTKGQPSDSPVLDKEITNELDKIAAELNKELDQAEKN